MDNGGRNACNMWLENVEVLVKSSSSADEHRATKVGKSDGAADVQSPDFYLRSALRKSNCSLTRAIDGRRMRCSIISS